MTKRRRHGVQLAAGGRVVAACILLILALARVTFAQPATGTAVTAAPTSLRLLRVTAGPSGKTVGPLFVFDETRDRFVFPQDQSVTVFFQWEAPLGDHVLSATWRQPDGRVAAVSQDVRMATSTPELNCYWTFSLATYYPPGIWSLDVRVDGQPAGTHVFELAGVQGPPTIVSLDDVFKKYQPSLVRVHRFDAASERIDSSTGFVSGPNAVTTAFQAIDSAKALEVEFSDGRRVAVSETLAVSRTGDWAVLKVDTGSVAAIPAAEPDALKIGMRLAAFDFDTNVQIIGAFAVGAVSRQPLYGGRIQFSPGVTADAIGGPLLDESGRVVGVAGGSFEPGSRVDLPTARGIRWAARSRRGSNFGAVMSDIPVLDTGQTRTLATLQADGIFSPPVVAMRELLRGGTTRALPKSFNEPPGDAEEFSAGRGDQIIVYTYWAKLAETSRGQLSITLHDVENRSVATGVPLRINLRPTEQRASMSVGTANLTPGRYRIDVLWDAVPVWRTYVLVVP
jgi:hypothetical protein